MDYQFAKWFCCLNPRERNMMLAMLPFFVIPGSFVERTTWELYATALGLNALNKLSVNWKRTYHMYDGVIEVPDEPPLEVVYFESLFWLAFGTFFADPDNACTSPCEYLVFSS